MNFPLLVLVAGFVVLVLVLVVVDDGQVTRTIQAEETARRVLPKQASYEERVKAFREANGVGYKQRAHASKTKPPVLRTKPVRDRIKSKSNEQPDTQEKTDEARPKVPRNMPSPLKVKRSLNKFRRYFNLTDATNLTDPTQMIYGEYDQCSQHSLTKFVDTNETSQALLQEIHRNLSQRFTSLNFNETQHRCYQKKPPWDARCPSSDLLSYVPKQLKQGNLHKSVMDLEYIAKMMLGDDNEEPKILHYPRIEYYLWQIARLALIPTVEYTRPQRVRRVLHVATELFHTGGHTKVMQSFIKSDKSDREHIVFIRGLECRTIQCIRFNALYVTLFSFLSRERIHTCRAHSGQRIIHCSQVLRNLTDTVDLVVLHVHQYDTVPILAFGDGYHGPPVCLFDHSDHTFWLGSTILDSRLTHRQAAFRLSSRRGIDDYRTFRFSYPVSNPYIADGQVITKADARKQIGIPDDRVLLLSMAASYKFHPLLLELVTPVLDMFPDAFYIAIGPEDWNDYPNKFNSKQVSFRPADLGGLSSYLYHIAADVHIDSFPFTSLTSALETIKEEGIALSFCPWQSTNDLILCIEPDDFAAPSAVLTCPSASAFTKKLAFMVASPSKLQALQRYGAIAMRRHDTAEWTIGMDELYHQLLTINRRPALIDHKQDLYDVVEGNIEDADMSSFSD